MRKICTKCNKYKPISCFHVRSKKDGTFKSHCKQCCSVRDQAYYVSPSSKKKKSLKRSRIKLEKRNRTLLLDFLSSSSCKDCGIGDIRVLDFDHLKDKRYTISARFKSLSVETLVKEMEKCDVVCANCHRIRTSSRANDWKHKQHLARIAY